MRKLDSSVTSPLWPSGGKHSALGVSSTLACIMKACGDVY